MQSFSQLNLKKPSCKSILKKVQTTDPKFAYESFAFDTWTSYVCLLHAHFTFFFCSGLRLGVRKLRNLIEFGLQGSLKVGSMLS